MEQHKARSKEVIVMKVAKRIGAALLAMLAGIFMPLLLWVALTVAFRRIFAEWRAIGAQLRSGNVVCSINSDCPTGYECIGRRCLPMYSR